MTLRIALDFDGTFTAAEELWMDFIQLANARGFVVDIVTIRHPELDRLKLHDDLLRGGINEIIYCDGRPKKDVAAELAIEYDIWIDDRPAGIIHGTNLNAEQLAKWRENDAHRDQRSRPTRSQGMARGGEAASGDRRLRRADNPSAEGTGRGRSPWRDRKRNRSAPNG